MWLSLLSFLLCSCWRFVVVVIVIDMVVVVVVVVVFGRCCGRDHSDNVVMSTSSEKLVGIILRISGLTSGMTPDVSATGTRRNGHAWLILVVVVVVEWLIILKEFLSEADLSEVFTGKNVCLFHVQ